MSGFLLLLFVLDDDTGKYLERAQVALQEIARDYTGFSIDKQGPWVATVLLARMGDAQAIAQVLNTISSLDKESEDQKHIQTSRIFPFRTMILQPEIVAVMAEYLKDDKIIDQGEDIMIRYAGMAFRAACVLYVLLEDFPEFSIYKFSEEERQKLVKWVEDNDSYIFRKGGYWTTDKLIARTRRNIFHW